MGCTGGCIDEGESGRSGVCKWALMRSRSAISGPLQAPEKDTQNKGASRGRRKGPGANQCALGVAQQGRTSAHLLRSRGECALIAQQEREGANKCALIAH
jgi:hypothetical protein